jgi:hypothetical protein
LINNSARLVMRKSFFFTFWLPCLSVIPFSGIQKACGAEGSNIQLIGHSDLQGRDSLQIVLKGNYAYVGHHRGREMNPTTGALEWNGTTILDVTDPGQPRIIKHLPGHEGPVNPPISATQKYRPPADPMYLAPTSRQSIKISSIIGIKVVLVRPREISPAMSQAPETLTTIRTLMAVCRAQRAMKRPLPEEGIKGGMNNKAGRPAASGKEAAYPE